VRWFALLVCCLLTSGDRNFRMIQPSDSTSPLQEETLQEENMQADSPAEFFRALSDAGIRSAVEKKASQVRLAPHLAPI
jgi:hypothetical protein